MSDGDAEGYADLIEAAWMGRELAEDALDDVQAQLRNDVISEESPMPQPALDIIVVLADPADADPAYMNTLALEFERRGDHLAAGRAFATCAERSEQSTDVADPTSDEALWVDAWRVRACDNLLAAKCGLAAVIVARRIRDPGYRSEAEELLKRAYPRLHGQITGPGA